MRSDLHLAVLRDPKFEIDIYREAAKLRGLECIDVIATKVSDSDLGQAQGKRLLIREDISREASFLEKILFAQGAYCLSDPTFGCTNGAIFLKAIGLPMPKSVYGAGRTKERLQQQVDWLGGLPIVVKEPGTCCGFGVNLASSLCDVQRQVEIIEDAGKAPRLEAYIRHPHAYRITVFDGQVVATTKAVPAPDDFRTNQPGSKDLGHCKAPVEAERIAIAATSALRLTLGGVDILEDYDGGLWLAEVNYPCSLFDNTDLGIPIAEKILDFLIEKSQQPHPLTEIRYYSEQHGR